MIITLLGCSLPPGIYTITSAASSETVTIRPTDIPGKYIVTAYLPTEIDVKKLKEIEKYLNSRVWDKLASRYGQQLSHCVDRQTPPIKPSGYG